MTSSLEHIREYARSFDNRTEKELLLQIKKMRAKGFSMEWIDKAITHKEPKDWQKWGFGLLYTTSYQEQITHLIEKEAQQIEELGINLNDLSWEKLETQENLEEEVYLQESRTKTHQSWAPKFCSVVDDDDDDLSDFPY